MISYDWRKFNKAPPDALRKLRTSSLRDSNFMSG